jgi:hypothetical protein
LALAPVEAGVDNDVLIKTACYELLGEVLASFGGAGSIGVLGSARYVVRANLREDRRVRDPVRAEARWIEVLAGVLELEPDDAELELATEIEEAAAAWGMPLDSGESQLFAIAAIQGIPWAITGDKKAIAGLHLAPGLDDIRLRLEGRLVCLEQLAEALIRRLGSARVRDAICSEPEVDTALSICMGCLGGPDAVVDPDGLTSYVEAVRADAPSLLAQRLAF